MGASNKIRVDEAQALVMGIPKHCTGMVFVLGGVTYTVPQAVALATNYATAGTATVQAKAAYHASCVAEKQAMATDGPIIEQLRENLALAFSNSPQVLADLQIPPKKPRKPLSGAALAARSAKATATRAARGTTSKKQKLAVKGGVTGVQIIPITTGTAAATPSASGSAAATTPPAAAPAGAPHVSATVAGTAAS